MATVCVLQDVGSSSEASTARLRHKARNELTILECVVCASELSSHHLQSFMPFTVVYIQPLLSKDIWRISLLLSSNVPLINCIINL